MILCNDISFDLVKIDDTAIMITVVGYVVVFIALAIMVIMLTRISKIQAFLINRRLRIKGKEETEPFHEASLTGDENAAICTALYLYFSELHDEEKYVMTVKKVSKTYSPWNSKIYGIMHSIKN